MPAYARRQIYLNPSASSWVHPSTSGDDARKVQDFHRELPGYAPTPLVSLDNLAKDLGVAKIYVKNESSRLSLPSFKILGASYGVFRSLVQHLQLPPSSTLAQLTSELEQRPADESITIVAATDGNHGRAVAHFCSVLPNCNAHILVPADLSSVTVNHIASEGALVTKVAGNYDATVRAAFEESQKPNSILVQDTSFPGYEEIPKVCEAIIHLHNITVT